MAGEKAFNFFRCFVVSLVHWLGFFFEFSSKKNILSLTHNQTSYAIRVAKTKPTGLQGVQEGDAEVLLQARPDEAHGRAANAGAVLE